MSDMTPREAADLLAEYLAKPATSGHERPAVQNACHALIDHARTTSPVPEGGDLVALAAAWEENAAEQRRILRSPNVTVDEAHSCVPIAEAWEEAAGELRLALTTHRCAPAPSVAAPPREDAPRTMSPSEAMSALDRIDLTAPPAEVAAAMEREGLRFAAPDPEAAS